MIFEQLQEAATKKAAVTLAADSFQPSPDIHKVADNEAVYEYEVDDTGPSSRQDFSTSETF